MKTFQTSISVIQPMRKCPLIIETIHPLRNLMRSEASGNGLPGKDG